MELIDRARQIDRKIEDAKKCRDTLPSLVTAMARANGRYAREFQVALIKLRAKGEPATICNKLAEGECNEALIAKFEAEGVYKITIEKLRGIYNELNGCQSVFRYFSHT